MQTIRLYNQKLIMILIPLLLLPYISFADTYDEKKELQNKISAIEMNLNDKIIERENLLKKLNKISNFSAVARSWFSKVSQKEAELKGLIKRKRNDFENNPVVKDIKKRKKELQALEKLNGNTVISHSNKRCTTLKQLFNEFYSAADKSKKLNTDLATLNKEIKKKIKEHDLKSNYLETLNGSIEDQKQNIRSKIDFYKKEYDYLYNLAYDTNSWIMMDPMLGEPIIVDKGVFLRFISQEYLKNIRISADYDPVEFAKYVKKRQKQASEQTKAFQTAIKKYQLPDFQQEIDNLNKKLNGLKVSISELQGCWLFTVGRSTSMIDIYRDRDNFYHGVLVKNKLKYYKNGSEIFKVKRQTHDTFKGYENTFTRTGTPIKNNLIIKVHKNGSFLTYRSDASTTMHRCR